MQLKVKVMYSLIASAAVLITSIFIPIIPCRISPNIPNPIYKWTLCSLNPDNVSTLGSITEYFGYTSSMKDTYILTVLVVFLIAIIFFHYTTKTKKK